MTETLDRMIAPSALALDLSSDALRADPYPTYEWLRSHDPVHRTAQRSWLITRYADCAALLRDRRASSDMRNATADAFVEHSDLVGEITIRPSLFYDLPDGALSRPFLFTDPPDHDRLRRLAAPPFRPLALRDLDARVDELASTLVSTCIGRGRFDVVEDIAYPLPVTIICDLLGIPEDARGPIKESAGDVGAIIDAAAVRTSAQRERTRDGLMKALGAMLFLIGMRQNDPSDDLVSHMLSEDCPVEDVMSTCALLLVAGHETTVNLIANGTLALLQNEDELACLADEPELIPDAIEELLRYDAPVQLIARVALETFELRGKAIEAGEQLLIGIGSANRDQEQFAQADRLDVRRPDAKHHIAFGSGLHYCLGASLARMEATAVMRHLVPHLARFRVAEEPTWRPVSSLRSLTTLHLEER